MRWTPGAGVWSGVAVVLLTAACAGPPAERVPPADGGSPAVGAPETPDAADGGDDGDNDRDRDAGSDSDAEVVDGGPVSVGIDAVGVRSGLIRLGLRDDGTMEVPEDPDLAGWYAPGGRPGGPGPTVIVGHVDSTDGPAVFARLRDLAPGDTVRVGLGDDDAVYRVARTEEFPQDAFPTVDVFGAVPEDELRLITCHGDYDDGYTENLVVFATRV
ncbi:sortase domain-containing protein [Streptomyces otsuchiensis]|uniref:sortase domain-containing protein n=1 Tax=Streptomyces otsuchiensis TaxID=2681388 RepID=UPI001D131906|nr:sortase [Streptomyces otsuchiensis]